MKLVHISGTNASNEQKQNWSFFYHKTGVSNYAICCCATLWWRNHDIYIHDSVFKKIIKIVNFTEIPAAFLAFFSSFFSFFGSSPRVCSTGSRRYWCVYIGAWERFRRFSLLFGRAQIEVEDVLAAPVYKGCETDE